VAHPKGSFNYTIADGEQLWANGLTAFTFSRIPLQIGSYKTAPEVFEDTGIAFIPRPSHIPHEERIVYSEPRVMMLVNKSEAIQKAAEDLLIFINQKKQKIDFLHTNAFMLPIQKNIVNDPTYLSGSEVHRKMKKISS